MLLVMLLAAHCVCDYPLQGDFLARAKNRFAPVTGIPWYQALAAHAMIHGGAVALITGDVYLGFAETVVHALIDDSKCAGRFGFNTDQALHFVCKLAWFAIALTR